MPARGQKIFLKSRNNKSVSSCINQGSPEKYNCVCVCVRESERERETERQRERERQRETERIRIYFKELTHTAVKVWQVQNLLARQAGWKPRVVLQFEFKGSTLVKFSLLLGRSVLFC